MTIPPLDLILLLGACQGFILAGLLWFNPKGRRLSNRLLAFLIGLLAMASLAVGIPVQNSFVRLALELTSLINVMPIGPLIYFYTRSLLEPDFRLGKKERLHFYPTILDWGAPLIGWTFLLGVVLKLVSPKTGPEWGQVMDEYNAYADIPRWLSLTIYLGLTRRWLLRQERAASISEQTQSNLPWLRLFLTIFLAFQLIWLFFLVPYIAPAYRNQLLDTFGWYPIYIPIAVMIYWLGLRGYLHARSTEPREPIRKKAAAALAQDVVQETATRLQQAMTEQKLYLDPELTVEKLGRQLQIPAKTISAVLNQHLGKSFNTFVNEYRLEEVKQRLTQPAKAHLTMIGIAFDCGFNSQATFQRAFKQMTGMSPKEYLAKQAVSQSG
ncbi:helix-turn-helix domain-containing protein [Tellurirhabdus bombi]|uniref:helix-turn-helix domain-containing protein n=1 Tax=Tellurirhabdus bombi TaxID=2907205 RepID=UPI001F479092|nr:helix-turn-helix transcriptional regulator [Tellurirhabdus bombi]